jgi:hypothetical protein
VKTLLKYVGNFVELGYDDHPNAPSLDQVRGKRTPENKDRVVAYLRGGTTLVYSPGRDDDVLDDSKSAGSASVATDGVYVWPRTLAYYVEAYDASLPSEFEAHMQSNNWTASDAVDKSAVELPRF